jgi:hypothetical protein
MNPAIDHSTQRTDQSHEGTYPFGGGLKGSARRGPASGASHGQAATIPPVLAEVCALHGWRWVGQEIDIPLEGGRAQRVKVERFSNEHEALVRITTVVGDAGLLSESRLRSALAVNSGLAHGALAIRHQLLVLTDTFLASDATHDHVESALRFLASTADRYEKVLFGTDRH